MVNLNTVYIQVVDTYKLKYWKLKFYENSMTRFYYFANQTSVVKILFDFPVCSLCRVMREKQGLGTA
jgi:hypothetical protein